MLMVIPTWRVRVKVLDGESWQMWRVPESNLDNFLHVLTFNKAEFSVQRESQGQSDIDVSELA